MATEAWKQSHQEDIRAYRRKWYANNRDRAKRRVLERKRELWLWFQDYKSQLKCNRCPETHVACLDFHHQNPRHKEIGVTAAVSGGWSRERILKEIEKCEILCANCHRKHHHP